MIVETMCLHIEYINRYTLGSVNLRLTSLVSSYDIALSCIKLDPSILCIVPAEVNCHYMRTNQTIVAYDIYIPFCSSRNYRFAPNRLEPVTRRKHINTRASCGNSGLRNILHICN
jgi:hypothetical protein